eukprot:TRINITY_DN38368_c0_g1_i1.p2 TRINITY_DN38368_c0_g1~~TRINITY_DN38368_c0_g1_i1.p2  ORF type:complete len:176 (-),score=16.17 TRINITY_DN38368_c0_g1_i1:70-597(-)
MGRDLQIVSQEFKYWGHIGYSGLIETCIKTLGAPKFSFLIESLIEVFGQLIEQSPIFSSDYSYYSTCCPWLQVRILKILQYFPPPSDSTLLKRLHARLAYIVGKVEVGGNINKNNSDHCILFEVINLTLYYKAAAASSLRKDVLDILLKYVGVVCLLYTSPSPRDLSTSRMPSSA